MRYNIMYNSIILTSRLFGSFFIFSTSLILINKQHIENKKLPLYLNLINGLTLVVSSSVFLCSIDLSMNNHFQKSIL
jgi:hypothetical protein